MNPDKNKNKNKVAHKDNPNVRNVPVRINNGEKSDAEFCDTCLEYKLSLNHKKDYDFYCYNC